MNNLAVYVMIALSFYAVYRVLREARSYRKSWNISWVTSFKYHVEWKRQIQFIFGWQFLICVIWGVAWIVANYGCGLLKGIEC